MGVRETAGMWVCLHTFAHIEAEADIRYLSASFPTLYLFCDISLPSNGDGTVWIRMDPIGTGES